MMPGATGGWARSLASAGAVLAVLGGALDPATAADLGGSCCQDLEERVAELEATAARKGQKGEKMELKVTGVVHRALMFWDDGVERNVYHVDASKDATTLALEGQAELDKGLTAGFTINVDAQFTGSETTNQVNDAGDGGTIVAGDVYIFMASERLGTVRLGFQASASDGVDNINLADAEVVADFAVQDWNGSFFLRGKDGTLLTNLDWDAFFPFVAGTSGNLVSYTTPEIMGFTGTVAWGMDDIKDVGLLYSGKWAGLLEVKAGIGAFKLTTESNETNPVTGLTIVNPAVEDTGWGGSIAVRHIPTGLNLALNYSTVDFIDKCPEPGLVTGKCQGDDETLYVIGGIVRNWIPLGATSFYGEYFRGTRHLNLSDPDMLNELLRDPEGFNPDNPQEIKESVNTAWGLGVVQKINDDPEPGAKKGGAAAKGSHAKEAVMEVYLSYRHFEIDVDLIDAAGAVPTRKIHDYDMIGTGAIVRF